MRKNTNALIEQKNTNLSAQMNELSYTLPPKSQSLYQYLLNQNEQAESSIIQEELNSIINYEIVFLALPK
jgi:hypothetical protein